MYMISTDDLVRRMYAEYAWHAQSPPWDELTAREQSAWRATAVAAAQTLATAAGLVTQEAA
jgi:hypothetical protein